MSDIQEVPSSIHDYTLEIFSESTGSGAGSTQLHEDKWIAAWCEKKQNPIKKTEIKIEG